MVQGADYCYLTFFLHVFLNISFQLLRAGLPEVVGERATEALVVPRQYCRRLPWYITCVGADQWVWRNMVSVSLELLSPASQTSGHPFSS